MKRLLLFLLFAWTALGTTTTWTDFYVQAGGDNLNAGSTATNGAAFTYAGGTFVRATGVFTNVTGNPLSDGVAVGDFASIYTTSGATKATFVARVTGRTSSTITVNLTDIAGDVTSVSETALASTCKVGGAWAGPSGSVWFPLDFVAGTLKDASGHRPRVNIKGDGDDTTADYSVTAGGTVAQQGIVQWQGYTTTKGDGGRAVIDGGTGTAYYTFLTITGPLNQYVDLIFAHNGGSSTGADGVFINTAETGMFRCVIHDMGRSGVRIASRSHLVQCEGYANNKANVTGGFGSFVLQGDGCVAFRCIAHDNVGTNADGFSCSGSQIIECISDTNGRYGFGDGGDKSNCYISCDAYNNVNDGFRLGTGSGSMLIHVENCNAVKNGTGGTGYGFHFMDATSTGIFYNCGMGRGTQANTTGDYSSLLGADIKLLDLGSGSADGGYANNVTPWTDPANGDFRINLAAAKNVGRGTFTVSSVDSVMAYPDIGAAQHPDAAATARTYKLRLIRR